MKVKVIGAGSIGNHLSNACRHLGWDVTIVDVDEAALERTKNDIYPQRYGSWDEDIKLEKSEQQTKSNFDYIFIGTPPDSHIKLAMDAIQEKPKAILIEKPISTPDLTGIDELLKMAKDNNVILFSGYDHVVGNGITKISELDYADIIGDIATLDVEFREHWGGIFNAHPWLSGPEDTYLGFWQKGGGATGEHSHGINMFQTICKIINVGKIVEVTAAIDYVNNGVTSYDRLSMINVKTESGLIGRIIQDTITLPSKKWSRIQGTKGFIEWHNTYSVEDEAVIYKEEGSEETRLLFKKHRPDDFIKEVSHLHECVENKTHESSPIFIQHGLDTMLVIAAAHKSAMESKTVTIDYAVGYNQNALQFKS